jgi:dTDP-4-dehydrorhamnose reductase
MKILIFGASGMLGNAVLRFLSGSIGVTAFGTTRSSAAAASLRKTTGTHVLSGIEVENPDCLIRAFDKAQPDVVINCIGHVKQLADASDPLAVLPINSLLPHRLSRISALVGARFIHISTDCVFSGAKGNYTETDLPDALDLYGRSKLVGEVDAVNAITLRTSIIGHELSGAHGLIGWFLSQSGTIKGYDRAIFSGLPTVELARVIKDHVLPYPDLHGLYHVSSEPISKFDLLQIVAEIYGRNTKIERNSDLLIDRSLNSDRFRTATNYSPPDWRQLVKNMHSFG